MPRTIVGYKVKNTKNNLKLLQGGEKVFLCPCGEYFYISVGRYHEKAEVLKMDHNRLSHCKGRFGIIDTYKIYPTLNEDGTCPMCPVKPLKKRRRKRGKKSKNNQEVRVVKLMEPQPQNFEFVINDEPDYSKYFDANDWVGVSDSNWNDVKVVPDWEWPNTDFEWPETEPSVEWNWEIPTTSITDYKFEFRAPTPTPTFDFKWNDNPTFEPLSVEKRLDMSLDDIIVYNNTGVLPENSVESNITTLPPFTFTSGWSHSPWAQSSYGPDLIRRPLEIAEVNEPLFVKKVDDKGKEDEDFSEEEEDELREECEKATNTDENIEMWGRLSDAMIKYFDH